MHRAGLRTISTLVAGALAGLVSACDPSTAWYTECGSSDKECRLVLYADGSQSSDCRVWPAGADGCFPPGTVDCQPEHLCGAEPGTFYEVCSFCGDPILAEWPDSWTVTSARWLRALPPPLSGQVLIEPASNFDLPAGVGPIVTDPGYTASVLRMDLADIPQDTYRIEIEFDRGDLPAACVKGIQVAMFTLEPGGFRFITPLPGESLDLTT